jgi:thiol-disulfide isomerase/thioredoxin
MAVFAGCNTYSPSSNKKPDSDCWFMSTAASQLALRANGELASVHDVRESGVAEWRFLFPTLRAKNARRMGHPTFWRMADRLSCESISLKWNAMNRYLLNAIILCACFSLAAQTSVVPSQPVVVANNIMLAHEAHGWRVVNEEPGSIHWNLQKDDLIVRIDGRNASETGPMQMASYFIENNRRRVPAFIERSKMGMEIGLRDFKAWEYDPIGGKPFAHATTGFSAPNAEFETIDHEHVTLEQFKGKWLLLEVGASWCGPCVARLPEMVTLAEKEKEQLTVVGVEINDRPQAIQRMIEQNKIKFRVASMSFMSSLPIQLGVSTVHYMAELPAFVLIEPDGEVALIVIGAGEPDAAMKMVESYLNRKTETKNNR